MRRRRTPDGWVCDGRSWRDELADRLSDPPACSSPRSRGGNMETAKPYPFPPGTAPARCGRDVPPPPAPLGACSGNLPTKRSSSFLPMRRWEFGMSRRFQSSWRFFSGRATVPAELSMIHPRTSLTHPWSPSLAKSFLTDTKSLDYQGSKGKSHLRARTVLSKTRCCLSSPHCTASITSSI